jgi:pyocin large subunit-like protein
MSRMRIQWLLAAGVLALAACDGGPSAVAKRDPATPGGSTWSDSGGQQADNDYTDRPAARRPKADAPVKLAEDGRPIWASSRKGSAEEQAQKAFARNGEAFGADSLEAYVAKAHTFTATPPKGAQTLTRRNGDKLIYDPRGNIFAVVTRDGAPRTMFKPDDGAAYWEKVKAGEAKPRKAAKKDGEDQA